jgi:hypothetical protein
VCRPERHVVQADAEPRHVVVRVVEARHDDCAAEIDPP